MLTRRTWLKTTATYHASTDVREQIVALAGAPIGVGLVHYRLLQPKDTRTISDPATLSNTDFACLYSPGPCLASALR